MAVKWKPYYGLAQTPCVFHLSHYSTNSTLEIKSIMSSHACTVCNAKGAKSCSSCHSSAYCTPTCQRADWRIHKTVCPSLKEMPPRPTPSHKLGILFPVQSRIPQLIWYESERKVDVWGGPAEGEPEAEEERAEFDIAKLGSVMGDDKPPVQYMPFQINPVKRFELDHTLNLVCREEHGIDGSKLNRCILKLAKDKTPHNWRGPVVALRQVGVGYQPYSIYEDITLADLHHAVAYFSTYGAGFNNNRYY